jgi:hypothetical protein
VLLKLYVLKYKKPRAYYLFFHLDIDRFRRNFYPVLDLEISHQSKIYFFDNMVLFAPTIYIYDDEHGRECNRNGFYAVSVYKPIYEMKRTKEIKNLPAVEELDTTFQYKIKRLMPDSYSTDLYLFEKFGFADSEIIEHRSY